MKCVHVSVNKISVYSHSTAVSFYPRLQGILSLGKYTNCKPSNNICLEGRLLFGSIQTAFRNITFRHSLIKTKLLTELFHFSLANDHKAIKPLFFQVHSGLLGFPVSSCKETSFMQMYLSDPCS